MTAASRDRLGIVLVLTSMSAPDALDNVKTLLAEGYRYVLIVANGLSDKQSAQLEQACGNRDDSRHHHAAVIKPDTRLAQGAALKAGLKSLRERCINLRKSLLPSVPRASKRPGRPPSSSIHSVAAPHTTPFLLDGVVCAQGCDARLSARCAAMAREAALYPDHLIVASLRLPRGHLPRIRRIRLFLLRTLIAIFTRIGARDPLTPWRYIPVPMLEELAEIGGEGGEYGIDQIVRASRRHLKYRHVVWDEELPPDLQTYTVREVVRMYARAMGSFSGFVISAFITSLADFALFAVFIWFLQDTQLRPSVAIASATLMARVISSIWNYLLNKNYVFDNRGRPLRTVVGYFCLAVVQFAASALLVSWVWQLLGSVRNMQTPIKVFIDTSLFLASYLIQRYLIFTDKSRGRALEDD